MEKSTFACQRFSEKESRIYDNGVKDPQAFETVSRINSHRKSVRAKLNFLIKKLAERSENHDLSKLKEPEIGWLIEMDKEPRVTYGSPEYFEKMKRWEKFFKHHYANNRHHPDHFGDMGVSGMNLVDLAEYLCDIISYLEEMHASQAIKIIDEQGKRFGLEDQLSQILKNTLVEYFSWVGNFSPEFKNG